MQLSQCIFATQNGDLATVARMQNPYALSLDGLFCNVVDPIAVATEVVNEWSQSLLWPSEAHSVNGLRLMSPTC